MDPRDGYLTWAHRSRFETFQRPVTSVKCSFLFPKSQLSKQPPGGIIERERAEAALALHLHTVCDLPSVVPAYSLSFLPFRKFFFCRILFYPARKRRI